MCTAKFCGSFFIFLLPVLAAAAMNSTEFKEYLINGKHRGGQNVMGYYNGAIVYYDTDSRSYSASQEYGCRNFHPTSDLVIIQNFRHFVSLSMDSEIPHGTYWVNGMKNIQEYFSVTTDCRNFANNQDLTNIDVRSPGMSPYCLAFVKGPTLHTSYLQVQPCSTNYKALCQYPDECKGEEIPTTSGTTDSGYYVG